MLSKESSGDINHHSHFEVGCHLTAAAQSGND